MKPIYYKKTFFLNPIVQGFFYKFQEHLPVILNYLFKT